ncbi:hypothetical protein [uncultured Desulfobacter sp.]|uniref:hypothetical protein n=1 Tax=uncultured Desulfobacter sp. TaxID=240139 RepID=UPI00259B1C11|nr:hypothetical protein [uncultured Desulfobacter sp.]
MSFGQAKTYRIGQRHSPLAASIEWGWGHREIGLGIGTTTDFQQLGIFSSGRPVAERHFACRLIIGPYPALGVCGDVTGCGTHTWILERFYLVKHIERVRYKLSVLN